MKVKEKKMYSISLIDVDKIVWYWNIRLFLDHVVIYFLFVQFFFLILMSFSYICLLLINLMMSDFVDTADGGGLDDKFTVMMWCVDNFH